MEDIKNTMELMIYSFLDSEDSSSKIQKPAFVEAGIFGYNLKKVLRNCAGVKS